MRYLRLCWPRCPKKVNEMEDDENLRGRETMRCLRLCWPCCLKKVNDNLSRLLR